MTVLQYGDLPGVQANVSGGRLYSVQIGNEQKVILFGRGDPVDGEASYDSAEPVQNVTDATTLFGQDTRLADGLAGAIDNGANRNYLYGVMPTETTVSAEPIDGGTGTLANAPIVEDLDTITVTNTTAGTTATPQFHYASPPATPDAGTVNINPNTGEVAANGADSYAFDYAFLDWAAALDAADTTVRKNETAVYGTLSDSETVAQTLSDKLDELRPTYKLIRGVSGAQPNAVNAAGEPIIDAATYTDAVDDDALFLAGPVRLERSGDPRTVVGGIAGLFGGNEMSNPIYGDALGEYGPLIQTITPAEEGHLPDPTENDPGSGLRGEYVMPVRDDARDGGGGLTLEDSHSTSSLTDWVRDYHRRRVVDQVLITANEIGETLRGRRFTRNGDDGMVEDTEQTIVDALADLADQGHIVPDSSAQAAGATNTSPGGNPEQAEQMYGANAEVTGTDEISIGIYFRPVDVAKDIIEDINVSRSGARPATS